MDLDAVAETLAGSLSTVGLRASSEVPTQINPPAAVIGLGGGVYADADDDMTVQFGVLILLSSSNAKTAQKQIRDFVAATGANSVKTALEDPALFTGIDVVVNGWDPPAIITIGGIDYLGVEFSCEVIE